MCERNQTFMGRYPWNSVDSLDSTVSFSCEPQQDIQDCLNCTRSRCNNCKESKNPCNQRRKLDSNLSLFEKLVRLQKSRQQICNELGISRATYYNYANACGRTVSA